MGGRGLESALVNPRNTTRVGEVRTLSRTPSSDCWSALTIIAEAWESLSPADRVSIEAIAQKLAASEPDTNRPDEYVVPTTDD